MKTKELLITIILASLLPLSALADVWQDPETKVNYEYEPGSGVANVKAGDRWTAGSPEVIDSVRVLSSFMMDEIKYDVIRIGKNAFRSCKRLLSIDIPDCITSIGEEAFAGCANLQNVKLSEGLSSIGRDAFQYCNNLKTITIPKNITNWESAFKQCGLKNVILSEGLTIISAETFSFCDSLQKVIIPESVTTIGSGAFYYCGSLKSITVPPHITRWSSAFSNSGLVNVVISEGIESIDYAAFKNCDSLKNVSIPESVTSIGADAFVGCTNLKHVVIPPNVNKWGYTTDTYGVPVGSFSRSGLVDVIFSDGLTTIGYYAFEYCSDLAYIRFPASLTKINDKAFGYCNNIKEVTSYILDPFKIKETVFNSDTYSKATLYIPPNTKTKYETTAAWNLFQNIKEIDGDSLEPINIEEHTNRIYIPNLKMARGSEATLSVFMDNTDEVTAVEFTLEMPTGFTINPVSAVLSDRANNHQMTARALNNGKYKFVVMSQNNALIKGIAGQLFTVHVKSSNNVTDDGDYPMTISTAVMSAKNGQNILQEADGGKITIKSMPNLHVTSLDCSEPVAGQPLTVKWKVRNDGKATTGDVEWKDYIWLVPNISIGTSMEGSRLLAAVGNISTLAPNESYENTINVTLPERIYGNYDLVVTSNMYGATNIDFSTTGGEPPIPYDPSNATYGYLTAKGNASYITVEEENEYNGTSDNFFYIRINISVPPLPDIQVPKVVVNVDNSDYIISDGGVYTYKGNGEGNYYMIAAVMVSGQASNTAFYSGKKVKVTATIQNKGGAEIPSTTIRNMMFISSTPDMNSGKTYLLSVGNETISLKAEESTTTVLSGYIPIDWYGDAYFIVMTDVDDAVYELANTENNIGTSNKVDVLLTPGADLEPYGLTVPTQISAGTSFNIKYSVRNIGPGAPYVSEWKDKVYLSSKSSGLDESAVCIGEIKRTGTFSSEAPSGWLVAGSIKYLGDAYDNGFSVKVDHSLPAGTYYIYIKVDANDDVFEYDGEDNNVIISQAITLSEPDLTAGLLSVSEETLITDNTVAVSWKLQNIGNADIVNVTVKDGFYASSNANGNNAVKIAEVVNTISIVAGGEKVLRANITIPAISTLSGTRYFFVKTNINGAVPESNTSNNSSTAIQKAFEYMDGQSKVNGMNLSVGSIQVAQKTTPGETISLSYIVTNNGTLTINKNVKQEVFFSKSKTFDASARICAMTGTLPELMGLQSGESVNVKVQVTIPTDMKGGQNYIYVVINRDNALTEKKTNDNTAKSPVYVNGNLPNFTVTGLAVPSTVMTSEKTGIAWTLTNTGDWDADAVTCKVYLSTDKTWNNSDKLLANVSLNKLAKGSAKDMKATIELDDGIVGSYFIIVKADYSQEEASAEDNIASVSFTAQQSPLPDLVIYRLFSEGTWRGGQAITIKATAKNTGDDATHNDKWTDVFYLSEGYTLDVGKAIKLGSKTHVGKLEKDGTYEITASVNIPTNVKGYYVLFAVVDGINTIVEKAKDNNQAKVTVYVEDKNDTPADIVVKKIASPSHIMAGELVTISYTLANNGEFPATGMLRDVLYMSKDNRWDKDDVMVGVVTDKISLEPGNEIIRTVTGRITNIPEGSYYLIVRTNSTHGIAETDYNNNMAVQTSPSKVAFATLSLGSSVTVNTSGIYKLPLYGVEGKTIGLYLSTPNNATAGLYTSFENVPSTARYDRAATDLEQTEQEVLIPDVQEGNYYILAQDNAAANRSLADFSQNTGNGNNIYLSTVNAFVIGSSLPSENTTTMTLSAREVQFGATTLSIKEGGSNGWLSTKINGALLDSIMDFRLVRDGEMIPAESVTFYDQTSSKATFNLNDAAPGSYDVVSELPNGTMATLPDGFKIIPGTNVALGVKLDAVNHSRVDGYAPVNVAYVNGGNTDIVIRELLLTITGGYLSKTIEGFDEKLTELHIRPDVGQDNRGFVTISPGMQETVNYYFKQTSNQTRLNLYIVK